MSQRSIAGIVLLGIGLLVLFLGGTFSSQRDVLRVGDVSVTATEHRSIPPWVGGAVVVAGAVLLVAGLGKKSA